VLDEEYEEDYEPAAEETEQEVSKQDLAEP
jgi:hypothetical protein